MGSYDQLDKGSSDSCCSSGSKLILWVLLTKIFALTAVVAVGLLFGKYLSGFDWSKSTFSYHPLLMTIGLIYLFGDAIIVYRVLPNTKKFTVKLIHTVIQMIAAVFIIVGLYAVFNASKGGLNLRSLHSWVGIFTVVCFFLQLFAGTITFLFPGLSTSAKTTYKPAHVFWGLVLFCLAGVTCLLGVFDEGLGISGYEQLSTKGLLVNFYGVAIIATVITTAHILTKDEFKRVEPIDTEIIPLN